MPAEAITPIAGHLDVGDTWLLAVEVRDDIDNELADADVAVLVTRPDASTATPIAERESLGQYVASYVLAATGRHTAVVTVSGAVVGVATFAVDAEVPNGRPTLAEVKVYLGESAAQWTDPEISGALAAEASAQARKCVIGAVYPADLAEALKRRVARNLTMRTLPLAVLTGDSESGGSTRLPGQDPEVRRLEAAYLRMVAL